MKSKLWIQGKWWETPQVQPLASPFDQKPVGSVCLASPEHLQTALVEARASFESYRHSTRYLKAKLLAAMAQGLQTRRNQFVERIVAEAGKPRAFAEVEVSRAYATLVASSEEAKRWGGDILPLDIELSTRAFAPAESFWVPRGPVLAISPFNFPLNLAMHKVAPALAAGATVVLKPPPQAPGPACLLAEVFEEAARSVSDSQESVPLGAFQVIHASNDVIAPAVTDPRISTLSFTGSETVGWKLQEKAVRKQVVLELGGNAAVIVHSDADLERAAMRCAFGAFSYAGQVCISVQRIWVHESVASRFQELLLKEVSAIRIGDPDRPDTWVGPMINTMAADRVMAWIDESLRDGAKALLPVRREGNVIHPVVLTGVKPHHKVHSEEVFGPVAILDTYRDFDQVLVDVNRSRFGLQAGVFTYDTRLIRKAMRDAEVGGLIVNEVPTFRADHMPYGGVKESGLGREGVRYAMEHFSERRTLVQFIG